MLKKCVRISGVLILLCCQCALAVADIISAAPDSVDVTIFRDKDANPYESIPLEMDEAAEQGLLMINETRTFDLPAGESRILLRGVADAIIPQTASLQGIDGVILESNFDYKLLTPFELLKASVGQQVTVVRGNPVNGNTSEQSAIIQSAEEGVVLDVDGKLEEFRCDRPSQKLIFHSLPPSLLREPSLSVVVRTPKAGKVKATLSYLAVGASWNADYVAKINADNKTLDLSAWITLLNARGTTFANAPVQVVAGKVEYDSEQTRPPQITRERPASSCWSAIVFPGYNLYWGYSGGDESVEEIVVTGIRASLSELGDYKLYRIPGKTTFAACQSKQVQMLAQTAVPFERLAHYTVDLESMLEDYDPRFDEPEDGAFPATTILRLMNNSKNNLGLPLPQGNISVMEEHEGRKIFVGQDIIKDQAVGLPFEIKLGDNPDVVVNPQIIKVRENDKDESAKISMDVQIKSYASTDVLAEIQLNISEAISARVLSASHRHHIKEGNITWHIKLSSNESKHLTYELFTREQDF